MIMLTITEENGEKCSANFGGGCGESGECGNGGKSGGWTMSRTPQKRNRLQWTCKMM